MTLKKDVFRFSARMTLAVAPPVQPGALPVKGLKATVPNVDGSFTIDVSGDGKNLHLDILWETPLEYDDRYLEPDQCPKGPRPLILPGRGGIPLTSLDASQVMYLAARPVLARIALASRSPEFIRLVDESFVPKIIPEVRIEVAGRNFAHEPGWAVALRTILPPKKLTASDLNRVLNRETFLYEYFGVQSDLRLASNDIYSAVALLTTQLEVASYFHLGAAIQSAQSAPEQPNFDPVLYLGDEFKKLTGKPSLRDRAPDRYKNCAELWGARHEVVHNGQGQIRPFDPATGRAAKKSPNKRALTRAEFDQFREGVQAAVDWMRNP